MSKIKSLFKRLLGGKPTENERVEAVGDAMISTVKRAPAIDDFLVGHKDRAVWFFPRETGVSCWIDALNVRGAMVKVRSDAPNFTDAYLASLAKLHIEGVDILSDWPTADIENWIGGGTEISS